MAHWPRWRQYRVSDGQAGGLTQSVYTCLVAVHYALHSETGRLECALGARPLIQLRSHACKLPVNVVVSCD